MQGYPQLAGAHGQRLGEVPGDAAAGADDFQTRTSAARAKLKGLTQQVGGCFWQWRGTLSALGGGV
mgnify:FL=1